MSETNYYAAPYSEPLLDYEHFTVADHKQRITLKGWKSIVLKGIDKIVYKGNLVSLKAKRIAPGVYEICKDLSTVPRIQ